MTSFHIVIKACNKCQHPTILSFSSLTSSSTSVHFISILCLLLHPTHGYVYIHLAISIVSHFIKYLHSFGINPSHYEHHASHKDFRCFFCCCCCIQGRKLSFKEWRHNHEWKWCLFIMVWLMRSAMVPSYIHSRDFLD